MSKPKRDARRRRLGQQTVVSKAEAESKVVDILKAKGALDGASVRGVARLIGARKSTAHNAIVALVSAGVVAKVGRRLGAGGIATGSSCLLHGASSDCGLALFACLLAYAAGRAAVSGSRFTGTRSTPTTWSLNPISSSRLSAAVRA